MEQPFEMRNGIADGPPVLEVQGEIDVATAPFLRERLHEMALAGHATIVVDLLRVTFIDSTALGVLVGALKACRDAGGELHLVVSEPRILKVFDITGLADVFAIHASVRDAVGSSGQ